MTETLEATSILKAMEPFLATPNSGKWANDENTGCWNWLNCKDKWGYGIVWSAVSKKTFYAHRFVYEIAKGKIPKGLQIDHLCRNPSCVNPSHLEAVTQKENCLRGVNPAAIHARQTHCIHGHKFAGVNVRISPKGGRYCRACERMRYQKRLAIKAGGAKA